MALGSQLPIRLDPETDARLTAAASRLGTSKSGLIRMLAQSFVDQCVQGGQVTLPPLWKEMLPARDERANKQKNNVRAKLLIEPSVGLNDGTATEPIPERKPVTYKPKSKKSDK